MNPTIVTEHAKVFHGSNLDVLPHLPDNSVDAIVTDPPYELGFMGKKWDNSGIAYSVELWTECLRVLKPGGHLLSFGGTRTWHCVAHPTVKPTTLMQYLITLVTPPSGTVLDPFTGSGSTGKAAILSGFNFIGIELTDEYLPIIRGRLEHAEQQNLTQTAETLF